MMRQKTNITTARAHTRESSSTGAAALITSSSPSNMTKKKQRSISSIKTEKILLLINDPPTEMELTAKPLEGETAGKSSRFVGVHDTIGIVKAFAGTISAEIEGTPYYSDFDENSGGEHHH
jgi:hypothetical protein